MRRWIAGGFLLLAAVNCSNQRWATTPKTFRYSEYLPKADLALEIPGLGPCTDEPNRTLHLDSNQPVTILVHGCNGSAGRFQALAEVFAFHGQQAIGFSYNDRDEMMASSGQLARAIQALSEKMQNKQITVIGHSQGGLLARKALVMERPDAVTDPHLQIRLVTISAPFSGIFAANHCGSPVARLISFGLVAPICRVVSGAKWRDITYNGDFITRPGRLIPQVNRHLKINSDERNTCLETRADGTCQKSDYIFSLQEQRQVQVDGEPRAKVIDVKVGHVAIVGDQSVVPTKLIAILQQEKILLSTEKPRQGELAVLLARLY
ncbi:MAG: alpha/beta hydrolase [Holophaga sp.]|nr:alpha/beta hydrolase [Holophaga sp.]